MCPKLVISDGVVDFVATTSSRVCQLVNAVRQSFEWDGLPPILCRCLPTQRLCGRLASTHTIGRSCRGKSPHRPLGAAWRPEWCALTGLRIWLCALANTCTRQFIRKSAWPPSRSCPVRLRRPSLRWKAEQSLAIDTYELHKNFGSRPFVYFL